MTPPAKRGRAARGSADPAELDPSSAQPADPFDREAVIDRQSDRSLRETYAWVWLVAVLVQVGIADVIFVAYAWAGKHWRVDAAVMEIWLSATVVEVIGIVMVITTGLFSARRR